jgi:hypothetical protein
MSTRLLNQSPDQDAARVSERSWDRLVARTLATRLDRQLASGCPPQWSLPLTIRARKIVSSAGRGELARRWTNVLDLASRGPFPRSPRALRCGAVMAADADVREMISVLISGIPIDARGAAMASSLLTDGTGPLYNPRSQVRLSTAVGEAVRRMDPIR